MPASKKAPKKQTITDDEMEEGSSDENDEDVLEEELINDDDDDEDREDVFERKSGRTAPKKKDAKRGKAIVIGKSGNTLFGALRHDDGLLQIRVNLASLIFLVPFCTLQPLIIFIP
jgi:hypothetical protein